MKKILILLLIFFVPCFAHSEDIDTIDKAELQCINNTSIQSEIMKCTQSAQESWEDEIKTYSKLLKKVLSKEDYKNLILSQVDWEDHKKEQFKMYDTIFSQNPDKNYRILASNFKREVVKKRAIYLRAYYNSSKDPQ